MPDVQRIYTSGLRGLINNVLVINRMGCLNYGVKGECDVPHDKYAVSALVLLDIIVLIGEKT